MASKSIQKKHNEYVNKYGNIPTDFRERLEYMCQIYNISDKLIDQILAERERRMNSMYYTQLQIILYQIPQGAKRPRYRIINRNNIIQAAKIDSSFIHVYSPDASYNHNYKIMS